MNKTSQPTITTIIPTYRRPKLLERAIRSVLAQTYPHFKVCVYDNASGDETAEVVAEITKTDSRVSYYCHAENIGMFENHKFGVERVETDYYSFLPDDDFALPNFYDTTLAGFENHPDAIISATDVIHLSPAGNILRTSLESWDSGYYPPPTGLSAIAKNGHVEFSGILFKQETIALVGPWNKEVGTANDLDFSMRIAAHHPIVVSKTPGAIFNTYRRAPHPFELSRLGFSKMIASVVNDDEIPIILRDSIKTTLSTKFDSELFQLGISYASWGRYSDAQLAAQLIREHPGGRKRYLWLSNLIRIHKHVPFASSVAGLLIVYRRHRQEQGFSNNQNRYSKIRKIPAVSEFLETL
jgi:glycosyltransferase involved in cell wall biosynthesis